MSVADAATGSVAVRAGQSAANRFTGSVADAAADAGSVADAATDAAADEFAGSVAVWAGQSAADRFTGSVAVRARMREARPGPLVAGSAPDRDGSAVDPGADAEALIGGR